MSNNPGNRRLAKAAATAAIVAGLAAGSYGIANAASGDSGTDSSSGTAGNAAAQPWGGQRGDETLLTGDTAAEVRAAALAEVSGGTIVRVETDADGNAKYEAHIVKSDGTPATVYVNEQFEVTSVESR